MGLRLGPTFGFLNDTAAPFTNSSAAVNANPRLDSHVGAYAVVPVAGHIALQPELLYVRKGGHFSRPRAESYAVERYRLAYATGALLGRYDVDAPGPLSVHAVAGLSVDLALSGTLRRTFRTRAVDVEERVALMETGQLRRWDVGALVGVGIGYPLGTASRLALEVRYAPGIRAAFSGEERPRDALSTAASDGALGNPFPLSDPRSALRHDVVTASLTYTLPLAPLL
jgi:hypothetical protein